MSKGRWKTFAALGLAGLACLSCGPAATRRVAAPRTLDAEARDYVRLALALGERDPDSLDFAVVAEPLRAEMHTRYLTLDTIGLQADALQREVEHDASQEEQQQARQAFLGRQLAALSFRAAMLRGQTAPFDAEAQALFATARLPDQWAAQRQQVRAQVLALLPGHTGAPPAERYAARYAAYDRRFLVPPERLADVMNAALGACRTQTQRYLALPPGESVELQFVRNQPWSAFSRYQGAGHSKILLNLDLPLTVDEVLELACHEGYPGHHVFNTLREAALVRGKGWPEAQVQTTFSPQSYVSEAAAAFAPRLAFSLAERIEVERALLFPLAGLPAAEAGRYVTLSSLVRQLASAEPAIARNYLDGELEFVRAGDVLAREELMAHAEAMLLYTNEYRSYMLAYTDGPERVGVLLGAPGSVERYGQPTEPTADERRGEWERFRQLTAAMVTSLP